MTSDSTRPKARGEAAQGGAEHEHSRDKENQKRQRLNALVGERVLHALGEPADLLNVQVRPLWEGRYRVNVLVGKDVTSCRVAHSYFLVTDGGGTILNSTPKIERTH